MSKIEIIRKYKKARNITDKYLLDSDEHYLVDEILALQEQVKKLTLTDVGCTFYCYDKTVANAEEDYDFQQCDKQCEKCMQ